MHKHATVHKSAWLFILQQSAFENIDSLSHAVDVFPDLSPCLVVNFMSSQSNSEYVFVEVAGILVEDKRFYYDTL